MRALPLLLCLSPLLLADETRARELVAQLGADDAEARETADAELRRIGEEDESGDVDRVLEEGVRSRDAEVSARCRAILDTLRYWERIVVVGGRMACGFDVLGGRVAWSRPRAWCQAWGGERRRGARAWVFERGGVLECVDLRTGARRWRTRAPDWGQPVEGLYWLGYAGTRVARISLADGATTWEIDLPEPIRHVRPASVAADRTGVYVETQEHLIALDATDGQERWRSRAGLLGLVRGALYVVGPDPAGPQGVRRLDPAGGEPLWVHPAPAGQRATLLLECGGPRDLVLFANALGHTIAVEAPTGKDAWSFAAQPAAVWVEPDGSRGWLAAEEALIVLDLANGIEIARFPRDCQATAFLHEDGVLYAADYDTTSCDVALRAFDVASRELLWSADVAGLQVEHSKYWQNARVERLGERLLFVGESAGGSWIEVVDRKTGRVVARHRP